MNSANALLGFGMAFFGILWLAMLVLGILIIIAQWKIFKKAGRPGWAAIVPFYNVYVLTDLAWGNGWLFLLLFVPVGNMVFSVWTYIKLARAFGKDAAYGVGLVFLPFVFMPMLGFGKAEYQGPEPNGKKKMLIATAITGVVGIILLILFTTALTKAAMQAQLDYNTSSNLPVTEELLPEEDPESDLEDHLTDTPPEVTGEPIEGYDDFIMVTMTNGKTSVQVPLLNSETRVFGDGNLYNAESDGISIQLDLSHLEGTDAAAEVSKSVTSTTDIYKGMSEYYSDVTTSDLITGDNFALQQISYNYIDYDGTLFPCIRLVKCEIVNNYPVLIDLALDSFTADEDTKELFQKACELYGIDFQFTE